MRDTSDKLTYEPPTLVVFGTLAELTQDKPKHSGPDDTLGDPYSPGDSLLPNKHS